MSRLQSALTASLASRDVRARLAALGMTPIGGSSQDARAMLEHDRRAFGARARQLRDEGGGAK